MDIVIVCPGQGSHKPGMAKDLAESFPAARAVLTEIDAALGSGLSGLMFEGPNETLTETHNAQPALFAHGAALWAVLHERVGSHVRAAAGHSLGEFTAGHAAGALSATDGARLVRTRGELMYRTGFERPGTMAAILGTLSRPIDEICAEASSAGLVVAANYNTDEQLVISGEVAAVERAMELAKASGAKRAVKLNVSGAFHSPLMEPAAAGFRDALARASWHDPSFPVYANVDASANRVAVSVRELLVRQLTSPVRWVDEVRAIARDVPGALFVELGPGNVLCGLIKRIVPGAETFACGTVADVNSLLSRIAAMKTA